MFSLFMFVSLFCLFAAAAEALRAAFGAGVVWPRVVDVVGGAADFHDRGNAFFLPVLRVVFLLVLVGFPSMVIDGNLRRTAFLTWRCSLAVPCCATRASALRACDMSGIGYLRSLGIAKLLFFMRLRFLIVLIFPLFL